MSERNIPYCDQLAGTLGYFKEPMNPPPAEKGRNVIQFALTTGCSHALCTFCTMYGKRNEYGVKTLGQFKRHVGEVISHFEKHDPVALYGLDRIFIGAGNALSVDTDLLIEATQYALERLKKATGPIPRRAAIYGNTHDILRHGAYGLEHLRCGGTCGNCSIDRLGDRRSIEVVFWGLESGCSEVLRIAGKGYN